jgi:hypothetical protein
MGVTGEKSKIGGMLVLMDRREAEAKTDDSIFE